MLAVGNPRRCERCAEAFGAFCVLAAIVGGVVLLCWYLSETGEQLAGERTVKAMWMDAHATGNFTSIRQMPTALYARVLTAAMGGNSYSLKYREMLQMVQSVGPPWWPPTEAFAREAEEDAADRARELLIAGAVLTSVSTFGFAGFVCSCVCRKLQRRRLELRREAALRAQRENHERCQHEVQRQMSDYLTPELAPIVTAYSAQAPERDMRHHDDFVFLW
jgi:hypothetical protein